MSCAQLKTESENMDLISTLKIWKSYLSDREDKCRGNIIPGLRTLAGVLSQQPSLCEPPFNKRTSCSHDGSTVKWQHDSLWKNVEMDWNTDQIYFFSHGCNVRSTRRSVPSQISAISRANGTATALCQIQRWTRPLCKKTATRNKAITQEALKQKIHHWVMWQITWQLMDSTK